MSFVLPDVPEEVFVPVRSEIEAMITTVRDAARAGTAAHTLEQGLFRQLLRLGHSLFQSFLTLSGPGDAGERLKLEDGREIKRLEPRSRPYRNLFGEYRIERSVYGQREGQRLEAIPYGCTVAVARAVHLLSAARLERATDAGDALCPSRAVLGEPPGSAAIGADARA
ncbi:hypothetical protein [Thiorhodococcus minor]|uniref:hypothetical protein n=1 Tax=Thiorhodococcus minor TaxID=57489 RepID=UPI001FD79171|nr:hypothetical protein [Thiorhodococcus minor]